MVGTYNHPQARQGRGGDSMMAHVTPGEQVVPKPVLDANPDLARYIAMAISNAGADPKKYKVGQNMSINPKTGKPEFGFFFGSGGIFGGHGGFLGNPITRTAAEVAASFIPVVGPAVSAGIGATAGATGAGQPGSGSFGAALTGGLSGYGIGAGTQALSGAISGAGAIPSAGTIGPQAGGFGAGVSNLATGAAGSGTAFYNSLVGAAPGVSKVLSALNLGSSLMGSQQQQAALGAQKIGNPDTASTVAAAATPYSPVQPAASPLPTSLSSMQSYSPDQVRSALATQGINGGLGSDEQAYYKNLLQRSLIGDGNKVDTSNPNFLMPIEAQYYSKKGYDTSNQMNFLQQLQG